MTTDRADYLARILMGRLAKLEASVAEDGGAEPDRGQRIQAIEKVLAVELGVTDGATMAMIEAAIPRVRAGQRAADRDVTVFAELLRGRLRAYLAQ